MVKIMNDNQLFVFGMIVNTLVTAMGMQAENEYRVSCGGNMAYDELPFQKLLDTNGITHNDLLRQLKGVDQ